MEKNTTQNMLIQISRVAGVTFAGRQEILKDLYYANQFRVMHLIYTTFKNEHAIQVQDAITGYIIGYIPREDIQKIEQMGFKSLIGGIGIFGDKYYCKLYSQSR